MSWFPAGSSHMLDAAGQSSRSGRQGISSSRNNQVIHLDQVVAKHVKMCEFACNRCTRAGRYRVSTLVKRFGRSASMGDVMAGLSADCPRRKPNQPVMELCGMHCPTLSKHF